MFIDHIDKRFRLQTFLTLVPRQWPDNDRDEPQKDNSMSQPTICFFFLCKIVDQLLEFYFYCTVISSKL